MANDRTESLVSMEKGNNISGDQITNLEEGIIIPLDRRSGQLRSTLPGHYRLPYFVYTGRNPLLYRHPCQRGCRCRRRSRCRRRLHLHPFLTRHPRGRRQSAGLEVQLYPPQILLPWSVSNSTK